MYPRPSRILVLSTAVAVVAMWLGAGLAGADVPGLPPGVTIPPRASDTIVKTTTTTGVPSTIGAPSTTTTTAPPPPAAVTQILPAPAPGSSPAAAETKIVPVPQETKIVGDTGKAATAGSSTTVGSNAAPVASLSPGQVDEVLRNLQKSGANSTAALLEALKPLQNLGMTAAEAAALGMGQFPVQGLANWTDDWLDPRDGPPPHRHQGNDLFTQFDTPVRAPADGTVRYENGGLGGLAAYVTTADGTYYYMAHLSGFATDLGNGAAVKQGRIVGFAGDSGNAKGGAPHVHFEIHPQGGAAVNPKPIIDGWVAAALVRVPALLASFQPPAADGGAGEGDGIPQILVSTGLTRRFSAPAPQAPSRDRGPESFNRAVLAPLTPPALQATTFGGGL